MMIVLALLIQMIRMEAEDKLIDDDQKLELKHLERIQVSVRMMLTPVKWIMSDQFMIHLVNIKIYTTKLIIILQYIV